MSTNSPRPTARFHPRVPRRILSPCRTFPPDPAAAAPASDVPLPLVADSDAHRRMEMTLHRATREFALALGMLGLPASPPASGVRSNEIGRHSRGFATKAPLRQRTSSIYWNPGAFHRGAGSPCSPVSPPSALWRLHADTTFAARHGSLDRVGAHLFVNYRTADACLRSRRHVPVRPHSSGREFPPDDSRAQASLTLLRPNVSYALSDLGRWTDSSWTLRAWAHFGVVSPARRPPVRPSSARHPEANRVRSRHAQGSDGVGCESRRRVVIDHGKSARASSRRCTSSTGDADATFQQIRLASCSPTTRWEHADSRRFARTQFGRRRHHAQKVKTQISIPRRCSSASAKWADGTISRPGSARIRSRAPVDFKAPPNRVLRRTATTPPHSDWASSTGTSAVPPSAWWRCVASAAPDVTVATLPRAGSRVFLLGGRYPSRRPSRRRRVFAHLRPVARTDR